MSNDHIVKSFDEDLNNIESLVMEMGGMVELQISNAAAALSQRNIELSESIINNDKKIDTLERQVDTAVVRILALRHPKAQDLRAVVVAPKIASNLERIGDYSKNMPNDQLFWRELNRSVLPMLQ